MAAAIAAGALVLLITALQSVRDGSSGMHVAWEVSFRGSVMLATLLLAYQLATWARPHIDTPREPVVFIVAMVLMWVWIACIFLLAMVFTHGSLRGVIIALAFGGSVMCISGVVTYIIVLTVRRRRKARL